LEVVVLFLGPAHDLAGLDRCCHQLPEGATIAILRQVLATGYPELRKRLPSIRIAVQSHFVPDDHVLRAGDEVALIPPVSGGLDSPFWIELVNGPLPLDGVVQYIGGEPRLGGIVSFFGATREESDLEHGPLERLDYEAYTKMALSQLQNLADSAMKKWGVGRVVILHRIGPVPVGEVSVAIAVAAPHRAEAFEACRWLIDTLKTDVPIWKKDVFADGCTRWVDPGTQGSCSSEVT
jgi:molybdopterin synthase catalytic subunit